MRSLLFACLLALGTGSVILAAPDRPSKRTKKSKLDKTKSWYPKKVSPPKGTKYPCEMTKLTFDAFPKKDRLFADHTFTMIIRTIWAKLTLMETWRVMDVRRGHRKLSTSKLKAAFNTYEKEVRKNLEVLKAEEIPGKDKALTAFRNDVVKAIELQLVFFKKGRDLVVKLPHPKGYDSMLKVPEGKQASRLLISAWGKIARHYKNWGKSKATKDSVYHHLCALDVF